MIIDNSFSERFPLEKDNLKRIIKVSAPKIIVTIVLALSFVYFYKFISFIGIIGIFLAFWIISNNLLNLIFKTKGCSKETILAHFGVGLLILGITSSSVWQEERVARMNIKDQVTIKNLKDLQDVEKYMFNNLQSLNKSSPDPSSQNF